MGKIVHHIPSKRICRKNTVWLHISKIQFYDCKVYFENTHNVFLGKSPRKKKFIEKLFTPRYVGFPQFFPMEKPFQNSEKINNAKHILIKALHRWYIFTCRCVEMLRAKLFEICILTLRNFRIFFLKRGYYLSSKFFILLVYTI